MRGLGQTVAGYRAARPSERAAFGILAASSVTIGVARAIAVGVERRRTAPLLRSLVRRAYFWPQPGGARVHHFVPGLALGLATGAVAIATRGDGRELWLSVPFGTGAGLALDEVGLLLELNNRYWGTETLALAQAGAAGLGAAVLALRFHRRGATAHDG